MNRSPEPNQASARLSPAPPGRDLAPGQLRGAGQSSAPQRAPVDGGAERAAAAHHRTACDAAACNGSIRPVGRRGFLFGSAAALVWTQLPALGQQEVQVRRADLPRKRIGRLSELVRGRAVEFRYPEDDARMNNTLLRLAEPAGGGVGPDRDVVAFNNLCTHQGGSLDGLFDGRVAIAGPCPYHWTTFDLSRHGMVVSGHATAGLPQILLDVEGDDIVAIGVQGLVFGFHDLGLG